MTIEELEEILDREMPHAEEGCPRARSLVVNALAELAKFGKKWVYFDRCDKCGCHVEEGELGGFDEGDESWCEDCLDWLRGKFCHSG